MNEQYSGERLYTPPIDGGTARDTNVPVEGSDPLTDNVPVETVLIAETPISETIVVEEPYTAPLDEPVARESGARTWTSNEGAVVDTMTTEAATAETPYTAPPSESPLSTPIPAAAPVAGATAGMVALLSGEEATHFRTRWNEIQGTFVDDPRTAVQQADALVSEAVAQITQMFASERSTLESQWKQNNDVSTEDLRNALKRYRSFFNRLVV